MNCKDLHSDMTSIHISVCRIKNFFKDLHSDMPPIHISVCRIMIFFKIYIMPPIHISLSAEQRIFSRYASYSLLFIEKN